MNQRCLALLNAVAVIAADVALAAEEAHHEAGGHEEHSPVSGLFFAAINFLLFVFVMRRYAWPPVRAWVRERHDQVVNALQEAAQAKADAERLRGEWQQRLAKVEEEITQLRAAARADAERERERILAAAQKAAESIRHDAERAAAAEVRRIQEMLRAELVRDALRIAEDATRTGWSADDQQRAVNEFLQQVRS